MDAPSGKIPQLDADVKDHMQQAKNIQAGRETAKIDAFLKHFTVTQLEQLFS
jgi:hypothetical protein